MAQFALMNRLGKKARISVVLWCLAPAPYFLNLLYIIPTLRDTNWLLLSLLAFFTLAVMASITNIILFDIAYKEKKTTGIAPKDYKVLLLLLIICPVVSIIVFFSSSFVHSILSFNP